MHLNESVSGKAILDVRPQPGDRRNYLGAIHLRLEVSLTAENADLKRYRLCVEHDGEAWRGWMDNAADHFGLTIEPDPSDRP